MAQYRKGLDFTLNIASTILIGASTNIDNLCMAMIIGSKGMRISPLYNFIISLISAVAAFAASACAFAVIPQGFANLLGSVLIIGIGVWTVISSIWHKDEKDVPAQELNFKKTLALGGALAVNCLPVAFGAGATGLSPLLTGLFIFIFSYISLGLGVRLGARLGSRFDSNVINAFSGVLLIALGLMGIFT